MKEYKIYKFSDFTNEDATPTEQPQDGKSSDVYKVGDTVIYLRQGKKVEEFDETKKPEEQKDVVGVKKIEKINGDKYTFTDVNGKEFEKTKDDIIKISDTESEEETKPTTEEKLTEEDPTEDPTQESLKILKFKKI